MLLECFKDRKNYRTSYRKLARYIGLNMETVRRLFQDEQKLRAMIIDNFHDTERERFMEENPETIKKLDDYSQIDEMVDEAINAFLDSCLPHPRPRTIVDARLFFWAYLPCVIEDIYDFNMSAEIGHAIDGYPIWAKAADLARFYKVSAKTLYRYHRHPYSTNVGFTSVKLGGSRLYLIDEVELVYPERPDSKRRADKYPGRLDVLKEKKWKSRRPAKPGSKRAREEESSFRLALAIFGKDKTENW